MDDENQVQAKEFVTITCSDKIVVQFMEKKRMQTIQNRGTALSENKVIVTGELLDKMLLLKSPDKDQSSRVERPKSSYKLSPEAESSKIDEREFVPETLANGVKSPNDQHSMVKSAIKKFESKSDLVKTGDEGLNQLPNTLDSSPQENVEQLQGDPKSRSSGENCLKNGLAGKPTMRETFSVETVEIIKEVMSP